jgi:hypothetical protein
MEPWPVEGASVSAIEDAILSIWRDVLGLPGFGIHDRPFEAGATSESLLRVHYQIEQRLNLTIPPVALFKHPSVSEFARHLHEFLAPLDNPKLMDHPADSKRLKARRSKRRRLRDGEGDGP